MLNWWVTVAEKKEPRESEKNSKDSLIFNFSSLAFIGGRTQVKSKSYGAPRRSHRVVTKFQSRLTPHLRI